MNWKHIIVAGLFGMGCGTAVLADIAQVFQTIKSDRTYLRAFLQEMPKGADLHIHADGAIYAEDYIAWAAELDPALCWDPAGRSITTCDGPAPQVMTDRIDCDTGPMVSMKSVATNEACFSLVVDSLSMRNFHPNSLSQQRSGHDQFFATFNRFGTVAHQFLGRTLATDMNHAAAQNILYLEPTVTLGMPDIGSYDLPKTLDNFAAFETALLRNGFQQQIEQANAKLNAMRDTARKELGCNDIPSAQSGCGVELRILGQSVRALPLAEVFAQVMLHFYIAHENPMSVGVNFVAPEDGIVALRDYKTHMEIFGYFKRKFPDVGVALHAGELWLGLVKPENLRNHIRQAIEIGQADRIGHGVGIGFEDNAFGLIDDIYDRQTTIEINLSSNEQILGVAGNDHPFPTYLDRNIPVVLATDDEGVGRIDLTSQYVIATQRYDLDYPTLKDLSRHAVPHGFGACVSIGSGYANLSGSCPQIAQGRDGNCTGTPV